METLSANLKGSPFANLPTAVSRNIDVIIAYKGKGGVEHSTTEVPIYHDITEHEDGSSVVSLVTYTEGIPEFLQNQDTLCIRQRGITIQLYILKD